MELQALQDNIINAEFSAMIHEHCTKNIQPGLIDALVSQPMAGIYLFQISSPVDWQYAVDRETVLKHLYQSMPLTWANATALHQFRADEHHQLAGVLAIQIDISQQHHVEIGYQIAKNVHHYADIADFILTHHERPDGRGYPHGLRSHEISLISGIVSTVVAFDAMLYRKNMSLRQAMTELENEAGSQFDPVVVDLFHRYLVQSGSLKNKQPESL